MQSSIHTVFIYYSDFFLVRRLYISAEQIIPLISDHLIFIGCVHNGDFFSEILRRVSFNPYLLLLIFFVVCMLNKLGAYIITFWTEALFYSRDI